VIKETDLLNAKLLIVDDQAANVILLERMLKGAGYRSITTTQNSSEVSQLYSQNKYDLILLDLQMPIMSGFQVMQSLSEIETSGYLPVLVITAQPDEKLRALKAGARDFVSKPFDLAEVLARVKNLLEVRLLNLETQRLYEQVLLEQQVSERLLHNVLPHTIVERLKRRPQVMINDFTQVVVDTFSQVSVLFADIVNFTKFSEGVSPEVLINVLNDIFTRFDAIADARGLEKIKTIGDSYMAVAGLPLPSHNHAERAANMAIDMQEAMKRFNENSHYKLDIRIGISTGAAVAGVIGKRKFLYDVWGDVVNTASRMESQGIPGRIQITDTTRLKLGDQFSLEKRGPIEIRGKGPMNTWFLNGRDS
jgi:adenylate cyclase